MKDEITDIKDILKSTGNAPVNTNPRATVNVDLHSAPEVPCSLHTLDDSVISSDEAVPDVPDPADSNELN